VETDRLHAFRKHFPAPWKERQPDVMSQLCVVMAQLYQACQERAYLQFTSNASSHVTNYDCFAVLDNKREELFYRNQTTKETTSVKLKPSLPWLIFMRG